MNLIPKIFRRDLDVPTEGTENTIWPLAAEWFNEMQNLGSFFSPRLAERVWVANRCIQLNAQQIASMPLRFFSQAPGGGTEPAWVANPDPNWFPNGIGDAVFAIVKNLYGWGYALLNVIDRYADGLPRGFTVLDSESISIEFKNGRRAYRVGETPLDATNIVQIDRNPGGLHGTSALRSYASHAWAVISGGQFGQNIMSSGGVPASVLKSQRKLTEEQARALQTQWMSGSRPAGAPAVLPPELDFETLSFSPKDLLLLDAQQFNARVVASAFGVPAFLLNLPMEGSLIYQNPQSLGEFWWRFELRCTAKRIADAMTANLLPRGNAVLFEASDTFSPLTEQTNLDDSAVIKASPADQKNVAPLRPVQEVMV
jgi:HK97 family phage portal protein